MIGTLMKMQRLGDARALAGYVAARRPLPAAVAAQPPTKEVVTAWAQGAHVIGSTLVYSRLTRPIADEPASAALLASCADNHDVAHRMLAKHEVIDARYEQASIPVIVGQLQLAGVRLAAVLTAAYPTP